jgi:pantothenate kinase
MLRDTSSRQPPPVITLDRSGIAELARRLVRAGRPNRRAVLAIAGVPGSGKSTLAHAVCDTLNAADPGCCVALPMDAYHMTNEKLDRLGLRDRKGAVQTFEAQQYFKHLAQVRDANARVSLPTFDRTIDEPVFTGSPEHTADRETRYIVTEGNYLLLDALPWTAIDQLADLTVWIDIPMQRARRQTIERHIRFGTAQRAAEQRYDANDRLNAEYIVQRSRHADLIARWP